MNRFIWTMKNSTLWCLSFNMKIFSLLKKYNQVIVIALATVIITLFVYLTPPGPLKDLMPGLSLFQNFEGDLPEYISRFALSFLLLALLPIIFIKISGQNLSLLGMNKVGHNFFKDRSYQFLILLCIFIGITSSFDRALAAFYPYSKTLTTMASDINCSYTIIHVLSYILFYYIPWEIFFRGFLIFPLLPEENLGKKKISPGLMVIASIQVIPSSLVHFGHPITETLGAIPFGIICAWLVLKYRSIIPGLILHAITGLTMDLFITYN